MKNIAEQITEGLDRFYKAFQRKRVLKSLEEISATTNEDDLASATAVAALSNKLSGFEPILNESGEITGYKTRGADTVHPFSAKRDIVLGMSQGTVSGNSHLSYQSTKAPCDGTITYTLHQNSIQAYAKKNGVTFASLTTYQHDYGYSTSGTLSVKRGDTISISTGERSGNGNGALFVGRYQ